MSLTLPSRANGYAVALKQAATREFFEAFLSSIHARLVALELTEADYQSAIDAITTQALAIVSANITDEVEAQREALNTIRSGILAAEAIIAELRGNVLPATSIRTAAITGIVATTVQEALAEVAGKLPSFALNVSPTFTGNPKAPTPETGDDDTSLATTEFVQAIARLLMPLKGGRLKGSLSSFAPALERLTGGVKEVPYAGGNVRPFTVAGAVTFNPTGLAEGDVLQLNVLYESGSIAVAGTTQWELGGGAKSASIADVGVALAAGAGYRIVFEMVGGVRTGVFQ